MESLDLHIVQINNIENFGFVKKVALLILWVIIINFKKCDSKSTTEFSVLREE